ncbi:GrpB family protein [Paenibacillus hamazuiensis]|uniref:GrpB family protein n=1 Tax=Paenibacillus hamazuiensis TaxID=2936508 RepID=UPI00200E8527|nr:GrpB family protein [Paenibacillus hamazuiensis]
MTLDESIHLEEYRAHWGKLFQEEYRLLRDAVGDSVAAIEHFGSTSVPGLVAKPIIDILIGVSDWSQASDIAGKLVGAGYESLGEAGIPGRLYLRKRGEHDFNAHVVLYKGEIWNNNLILRDYLRVNADEARQYGELKKRIVKDGAGTLLKYSDEKGEFVGNLLERAKSWAKDRHDTHE